MNATMKRFAKFTPVWAFVLAMGLAPSLWAKQAPDPQVVAEDEIDDVILDTRMMREIAVTDPAAVASEGLTFSASGWGAAAEGTAAISCTRNGGASLDFATGLAGDGVTNWTPVVNGTFVFTHTPDDEGGALTATYKVTGFTTTITVPTDVNYVFSVSNRTTGAVYEAVENKFTVETGDDYDLIITPSSGYRFVDPTEDGIVPCDFLTEAKTIAKEDLPAIEGVEYLNFTARGGSVTIGMKKNGSPDVPALETAPSMNGPWTVFEAGQSNVVLAVDETVYFRRSETTPITRISFSSYNCWQFTMATNTLGATVEAGGNVMSLLDQTCRSKTVQNGAFNSLFYNCTALTTAPELPAMELANSCYENMFLGCTALTTPPALPATNLAMSCYSTMFQSCTALTTAPELPATNLATSCYEKMFLACTALTTAPELPAMELANSCYAYMFLSCAALTAAPELPATNLVNSCYSSMFQNCTALTNAPALPATNLAGSCYDSMFSYCTALTAAPELPATELADSCYKAMFSYCTNLNSVTVGFTDWGDEDDEMTAGWLANVAPTGVFLCPPALEIKRGASNIPNGWLANPQTFSVAELPEHVTGYTLENTTAGSALVTNDTGYVVSTNDQVKITLTPEEGYDFVGGDGSITATITGSGIVFGEGDCPFPEVYKQDYLSFTAHGGEVKIGMEWVKNDWEYDDPNLVLLETATSMNGPWTEFEAGESNVTVAAETTVYFRKKGADVALTLNPTNAACYRFTMEGLGSIEAGGNVMSLLDQTCRSKTVGEYAFMYLFGDCGALTTAPEISATDLAVQCYVSMFAGCTSLTNAPALPAMNLAESCYSGMFIGCSALTDAPKLLAKELVESCYASMFEGCISLPVAPELSATNLADYCYTHMFYDCWSLTNAPALPATELATSCYEGLFYGCEALTNAPALSATNLATSCYAHMFEGCGSLTTAPALPATNLAETCYMSMFLNCGSLTAAPDLPAMELTLGCYAYMFYGCTELSSVKVGFTNWCEDVSATTDWLVDVAPTGIFLCPPALEIKRNNDDNGYNFIPEGWLANAMAFSVKTPMAEGIELQPFNNLTEGSAIYTNTFGFTDYAASSNDLIELTFKAKDGYRFINGDDMLDSTVVTAKIDKTGYVIGTDIPFPAAKRVYTFDLPRSTGMINASYVVTNGTTDITAKHVDGIDSESWRYTVVTGTTTTITFAPYNPSPAFKRFLRFPEVDGVLVTNPMVIAEISADHIYGYDPHETPYGVEAIDVTIPGVSNMTYYVSNTTFAAETFYPADCEVTNVFTIAKDEDTLFVFKPATGFRFADGEEAKNPITVNKSADYTIQDSDIPQVIRDMNTLKLANIAGLSYVVTNKGVEATGTLNGDYWEYAIDTTENTANIYFILQDEYTTDGDYTNPLSTNITEEVVTITAGAPGMPKVVYWYKVQYTNGPETNKTDTVKQDAEYAISEDIYPKAGYTFLGWTNTEAEVAIYTNNQVVMNLTTTPGGVVTLTAVHQPNGYTVKYTDGAEGEAVSNATYDVEFAISENVFEKPGYTFQYWTNLTDNVGYVPGEVVSNLTAEADGQVELTAIWTPNEYTVKYTDGADAAAVSNATYDVEFAISENVFEKEGYHFTGWTNEADSVGYQPGEVVSNLTASGEYELKAVWAPNKYEVKYVANGGVGDDLYTTNTFDEAFTAAGDDVFTKPGYTYNSWTNANGDVYTAGGECSNLSTGDSVTLYAAWVANGYKLAYEPGAGDGAAITNDCVYDVEYVVSNTVFSRTGYVQAGWTNLDTSIGYAFGAIVSNLTDEVDGVAVLTATWTPNEYKVKYVANGGEGEPAVSNATYDVEFAISENVFEKTGYHFTGWTNETDNVVYQPNAIVSNLTDEVDGEYLLKAVWAPNKYEVKYVANGGVGDDHYTTNTFDEAFTAAGDDVFTKPGYTYNSWTNANGDVIAVGSECMNLSTGDSVTLYAAWVANTYTLAYTPGDGTGTTKYDTLTYDDETYVAIEMPGEFAKDGHSFCCWTNGTDKSFLPGDVVSNLTDVAFATNYFGAAWTANVHTVTMPADIGPMTYVVSNLTTVAEITVTDNTFPASFGDEIAIYFTANSDYMLVGANTLSFTVGDEDKTISVGDLPCVSKLIIADWSDTVGVTNVEWNATNAVALINDKSKAVWVQFRYNFDDGSPIRETLPEGFGFRFEGGEGEGLPATFTTVPASSAALRKVSITGVLNTYCLTPLPADENYYIGDRLAYEAGAINAAPGGTNTEIKIEHAFIPVNPVVGVGTNAEDGCGTVTVVAENIDHDDGAVVLLGTNGVIKLKTLAADGIITAPRGYEVRVEEDGEGYKVYTVGKIGVVSVTVNDEDPIALLDEDIPDFVAELEAKLVEDPFDLYCITFNDDVEEFGTLRNVSAGTFILLSGSWREVYAPEGEAIGFAGGEVPAETVRVFMEGEGVQLMSETVVNGELASYVAVTSDYSIVVSNKLYLAGGIALGDGAKLKLAKGGVIYAKGDVETLIEAAEGCELVSVHDEYREWFIYVCRVTGATEVTVCGSETVTAADEIALAAIIADSVVIPADDEVKEYLEKSGKFAEYQALFTFVSFDNANGTYNINPELKDAVKEEIEASLAAAAAEILYNLKAESVPVETKVGLYYGVRSGTEADSLGDPLEWVMGTGGTVQLPFEAKGASGFYEVEAQPAKP